MFWCPVDRLRNRVETLANMQQEGVASVFLPHPASHVPCTPLRPPPPRPPGPPPLQHPLLILKKSGNFLEGQQQQQNKNPRPLAVGRRTVRIWTQNIQFFCGPFFCG